MVLITMTTSIVEALKISSGLRQNRDSFFEIQNVNLNLDSANESCLFNFNDETHTNRLEAHEHNSKQKSGNVICDQNYSAPHFKEPKVGDPISHKQVIELSKLMKSQNHESYRLEKMIRGSTFYVPPRPPEPEKTQEFKLLMERLRQEEEIRSYQQITTPNLASEAISKRSPDASAAYAFSSNYSLPLDELDDAVVYDDIRRQITLIFNVLISIVACGSAIWIVGKWWSTPMRLALSMSGSLLVGFAEVFIFWGYIRRVSEARAKEKGMKEVKRVVKTWVIQPRENFDAKNDSHKSVPVNSSKIVQNTNVRRRR